MIVDFWTLLAKSGDVARCSTGAGVGAVLRCRKFCLPESVRSVSGDNWMRFAKTALALVVLIGLWELSGLVISANPNPFPPPSVFFPKVLTNGLQIGIGSQATDLVSSVWSSVFRVVSGLVLAAVVGVPLALVIVRSRVANTFLLPVIQLFAPIAPIAWIPIAIATLGIGDHTAVFIVVLGVVFIFTIALINSIHSVSQDVSDTAKTLGYRGVRYQILILVPAILPDLIANIRVNFLAAWMAVLAAEMTGLRDGLGAIIMTGRNIYDYNLIAFGIFFIAIVGLIIDSFLAYAKRRYFWW